MIDRIAVVVGIALVVAATVVAAAGRHPRDAAVLIGSALLLAAIVAVRRSGT